MSKLSSPVDLAPKKGHVLFAVVLALLAQAADYFSTVYALGYGAEETNQIVVNIIEAFGYEGFFIYKLIGVAWFTLLTYWSRVAAVLMSLPFFYFGYHNVLVAIDMMQL